MTRNWLLRLGEWLVARYAPPVDAPPPQPYIVLTVPRDALYELAQGLTAQQECIVGRSGEAKRHQVLASLMKAYPGVSMRTLALAIEAALP